MCSSCKQRVCRECGASLSGRDPRAEVCSVACRKSFNNRRMTRGAELYDLFMNLRYERGLAKTFGLYRLMCRMAQAWREEDKRDRDGRASYLSAAACKDRSAIYMATVVGHVGRR